MLMVVGETGGVWWITLLFTLGILLGIALTIYLIRKLRRLSGARNRNKGKRAEKKAVKILQREGFRILEREPTFVSELMVDGHTAHFEVTPDLLVEKNGRRFVVEVKHYADNSGITNAGIRRQVMEYIMAAGLPCLLIKMPSGEIDLIELPEDITED